MTERKHVICNQLRSSPFDPRSTFLSKKGQIKVRLIFHLISVFHFFYDKLDTHLKRILQFDYRFFQIRNFKWYKLAGWQFYNYINLKSCHALCTFFLAFVLSEGDLTYGKVILSVVLRKANFSKAKIGLKWVANSLSSLWRIKMIFRPFAENFVCWLRETLFCKKKTWITWVKILLQGVSCGETFNGGIVFSFAQDWSHSLFSFHFRPRVLRSMN